MNDAETLRPFLAPGRFVDSDHPTVVARARMIASGIPRDDDVARGVALFYHVRDGIPYSAHAFRTNPESLKASYVLSLRRAFCVQKAVLLAALARAAEIPAKVGFADVRNHLASPRLVEMMKTDVFAFHGFVELLLDGQWVKATPAFDRRLCERHGVHALEFDGRHDALFHPYDRAGQRHMEYIHQHGTFADLPLALMQETMRQHYPHFFEGFQAADDGDAPVR